MHNVNVLQVYVVALEGYVSVNVTKTFNTFLDFCYIAQKSILTEDDLDTLSTALQRFHHYRTVFKDTGVRPEGFSLPRQHALVHYHHHIENFGAPNGLCSSITESMHIAAVKKPWRRSSRYNALQQMLTINSQNNKLAAARIDFHSRGMLDGTCLSEMVHALAHGSDESDGDESDEDEVGTDLDADKDGGTHEPGDCGPVDGPPILSEVTLASKKGTLSVHAIFDPR